MNQTLLICVVMVILTAKRAANQEAPASPLQDSDSSLCPRRLRTVCYFSNFAQFHDPPVTFTPDNIDPFLCTHMVFAFAQIGVNYTIVGYEWNDETSPLGIGNFEKFTNLKQQNPELKCLVSVGGAEHPTEAFTDMVASSSTRGLFIKNVIRFLRDHNFDGLDINWEYPVVSGSPPENKNRFSLLLQEMSDAFDVEAHATGQERFILSAALSAEESIIKSSYEIPQITRAVDYISVITYHFHQGLWAKVVGHHAALYGTGEDQLSVDNAVDAYLQGGCPPHKLHLGIATFGTTFTLAGKSHEIGAPANGPAPPGKYTRTPGTLSYFEICDRLKKKYTREFDMEGKVSYAYNENEWIGYDDELSVLYKVNYIRSRGLGGAMVWTMDMDDFKGEFCGGQPWPILSTIRDASIG